MNTKGKIFSEQNGTEKMFWGGYPNGQMVGKICSFIPRVQPPNPYSEETGPEWTEAHQLALNFEIDNRLGNYIWLQRVHGPALRASVRARIPERKERR